MTDEEYQPVAVSRRICAPAHHIFGVLVNPVRHLEVGEPDREERPRCSSGPELSAADEHAIVLVSW
jgi:hypothetical protein